MTPTPRTRLPETNVLTSDPLTSSGNPADAASSVRQHGRLAAIYNRAQIYDLEGKSAQYDPCSYRAAADGLAVEERGTYIDFADGRSCGLPELERLFAELDHGEAHSKDLHIVDSSRLSRDASNVLRPVARLRSRCVTVRFVTGGQVLKPER